MPNTLAWMFSCKFAAYFQNTFSYWHLGAAASASASRKFTDLILGLS